MKQPHVSVTLQSNVITIRVCNHPVRGMTDAEWLEAQCFRVLGKDEMAWCGSRWRKRIEEQPDKLERVLADMRVCRLEGKKIHNPGGFAEDLWKRFAP